MTYDMGLEVDRRLVVLAKRAFRAASVLPRQAMLDHVRLVMACSTTQAIQHLHDLEAAGLLLIRGTSTSALIYPARMLDTCTLRDHGVEVAYGFGAG